MAASKRPINGTVVFSIFRAKICWISHELELDMNHAMERIKPMSPMRLYKIACSAAVLASVRPCHQPISKKDMMPTPSHPANS